MIVFLLILIGLLIFSLWKWFVYWNFCIGMMYFVEKKYKWKMNDKEIKRIIEYSMNRNFNDLIKKFKKND